MPDYKSLSQYLEETAEKEAAPSALHSDKVALLQKGLNDLIDKSIVDLKKRLLVKGVKSGGVLNTLKRWWSNFWYGSGGRSNPYYYHNVFGSQLGAPSTVDIKKEFTRIPLNHYNFLKEQSEILEANLISASKPENTRLFAIINNWEKDFRIKLNDLLTSCMMGGSCMPSGTVTLPTPSKVLAPEVDTSGPTTLPLACEDPRLAHLPKIQKIKEILAKIEAHGDKAAEYARKIKNKINKKDPEDLLQELCEILSEIESHKHAYEDDNWLKDKLLRFNTEVKAKVVENRKQFATLKDYKPVGKIIFESDSTLYERTLECLEKMRS